MKSQRWPVQGLPFCCLAVVAAQSFAQAPPVRSEPRNQFEAGAWAVRHKGTLRAEPLFSNPASPADTVSLENDLGLKRSSTAYTLGYTRLIGQAWYLNAEYLRSSRDASTTTPRALQIGELSVPPGTALQSNTNFIQASFAAGLALVQREDTEFGVRMGGVSVRTRVEVTSPSSGLPLSRIESDVLPMLGLYLHTRHGEHWRFEARVDAAAKDGARSTHLRLALHWQPTPSLGLSAGLRALNGRSAREDFAIIVSGPADRDRVNYRMSGPQFSARLAF
jgi:hypothetical protein